MTMMITAVPTAAVFSLIMAMFSLSWNCLQVKSCHAYNIFTRDIHFERFGRNFFDKASLVEFYRANFHDQRSKKWVPSLPKNIDIGNSNTCDCDDALYLLRSQRMIVAALRLTRSKHNENYSFLRSLCVAREYRRRGLAARLLDESMQDFEAQHCYCFASQKLEGLYQQSSFQLIPSEDMRNLPKWLVMPYKSMSRSWTSRKYDLLQLFIKTHPPLSSNTTQIILLQHLSEMNKRTATGWLLDDHMFFKKFPRTVNDCYLNNLQLQRWVWTSRDDASDIERKIQKLAKHRTVHLLWTDSSGDGPIHDNHHNLHSTAETYIILDGTWQQAKKMFRKTPALWKLQRVTLHTTPPSTYVLRGDYSRWKERFSNDVDSKNLLCTAEVAAAVLDRCGDCSGANTIRRRLQTFQDSILHQTS